MRRQAKPRGETRNNHSDGMLSGVASIDNRHENELNAQALRVDLASHSPTPSIVHDAARSGLS